MSLRITSQEGSILRRIKPLEWQAKNAYFEYFSEGTTAKDLQKVELVEFADSLLLGQNGRRPGGHRVTCYHLLRQAGLGPVHCQWLQLCLVGLGKVALYFRRLLFRLLFDLL